MADTLSRLTLNGNQDTTHNSTYQQEIVSEINDTEEIPEGTYPIDLKLIQQHQQAEPILTDRYKNGKHHKGSFCGGTNVYIILITCKYKIIIISKIQSYVLHWYHTYILHPRMDIV